MAWTPRSELDLAVLSRLHVGLLQDEADAHRLADCDLVLRYYSHSQYWSLLGGDMLRVSMEMSYFLVILACFFCPNCCWLDPCPYKKVPPKRSELLADIRWYTNNS